MKPNTELGQGLIEYGLIALLVVAISALALIEFGPGTEDLYQTTLDSLSDVQEGDISEDFLNLDDWVIGWGKKRWKMQDGKLVGKRNAGIFLKDFSGEDYTIDVEGANLSKGRGYGVFFRTQNPDKPEGYIFQYDSRFRGGSFVFRKWVNGRQKRPFAVQKAPDFDWHDTEHDIQVQVEGSTYTAFVDGQEVLSASDNTYTEGSVGLRTYGGAQASFDGLNVTTP